MGIIYEMKPTGGKLKAMGVASVRRNYAPVVKDVFCGVCDRILGNRDLIGAMNYVKEFLKGVVSGNVPIEDLVLTMALRAFYANPKTVKHKVLADRIMARSPGVVIQSGDRVSFAYIVAPAKTNGKPTLQGDRIETPDYIKRQILKPVQQIFTLGLETIWAITNPSGAHLAKFQRECASVRAKRTKDGASPESIAKSIIKVREKYVCELMFNEALTAAANLAAGQTTISDHVARAAAASGASAVKSDAAKKPPKVSRKPVTNLPPGVSKIAAARMRTHVVPPPAKQT